VDEFQSIAELLAPLAGPEAAGLLDDAAFIPARVGYDLVVTKDALVEGVHFLPGTPADRVARKLLRVNLSDLAAKGADPFGYLLAVAWPAAWGQDSRRAFARGLAEDQARFGLKLLGGDTVSTPGPMTASITALGYAPTGRAVRRRGAKPGDQLFVSGTIGDGWLGLRAARDGSDLTVARAALIARYELPEPRLSLSGLLRAHASAALDVSDGLIADVDHLANASGVGVRLHLDRLPLSTGAGLWLGSQHDRGLALERLAAGGDDYEIAFHGADDCGCSCSGDARRRAGQGRRRSRGRAGRERPAPG
jgi:thiamine-monophosphate kinase